MKKIEVIATTPDSPKVREVLEGLDANFIAEKKEIGGQECFFYSIIIPDNYVDKIIEDLSKVMDLKFKANTISVYPVEAYVSTYLNRLEKKAEKEKLPPNPIEALVENTSRYIRLDPNLLFMVSLASIVTFAGLFLNNVAIIIGGMLISPLHGPINAFAINANLGKIRNMFRSEISTLIMLLSVIVLSAIITSILSLFLNLPITSQILLWSHTTILDIIIAIFLGCAGGMALFIAIPESLVGVAIAAALVPPATVCGIGLALFSPALISALVLTIVNLFGLQLGGIIILRIKRVEPRRYYEKSEARVRVIYSIIFLAGFLLLMALLIQWFVI